MKSIYNCRAGNIGGLYCVYKKPIIDQMTGKVELVMCPCTLKEMDRYVLYPEHDRVTGELIHNNLLSDPIPVGVDVIWEGISSHDHGLNYNSGRNLRIYNEIHPEYHIHEINKPITSGDLDIEQIGEIFGENEPTLISQSWNTQYIVATPRVEYCNKAIYGQYNPSEQKIVAKCMRDYTNTIKNWVNYTIYNFSTKKKKFFLCDENKDMVQNYLNNYFSNNPILISNLMEVIDAISKGEYINLKEIIMAHGISEERTNKFIVTVSTKTKRNLYTRSMNWLNYTYLFNHTYQLYGKSDSGKIIRSNIINFILNCPNIQIDPNKHIGSYSPINRYWLIETPLKRAWKEGIINKNMLPEWLVKQITFRTSTNKFFKMSGKIMKYSSNLPDDIKSDIADAIYYGKVDKKTGIIDIDHKNPSMKRVRDIIDLPKNMNESEKKRLRKFTKILRSGIKWNITEIRECWKVFNTALSKGNPKHFWNWIDEVIESSYSDLNGSLEEDGNISINRQFAMNLFDAKIDNGTFDVKPPEFLNRWYYITAKSGGGTYENGSKSNECMYNTFWNRLALIGGIGKDKKTFKKEVMNLFEEAKEFDSVLSDISNFDAGLSLDEDDFEVLSVIDPNREDVTIYEEN